MLDSTVTILVSQQLLQSYKLKYVKAVHIPDRFLHYQGEWLGQGLKECTRVCVCMCVRMRVCACACVCVLACMYACMRACMYVCVHACVRAYACVHVYVLTGYIVYSDGYYQQQNPLLSLPDLCRHHCTTRYVSFLLLFLLLFQLHCVLILMCQNAPLCCGASQHIFIWLQCTAMYEQKNILYINFTDL